jgi:hypothetical protein
VAHQAPWIGDWVTQGEVTCVGFTRSIAMRAYHHPFLPFRMEFYLRQNSSQTRPVPSLSTIALPVIFSTSAQSFNAG